MDSFYIGNLKGVGKVYQLTAIDVATRWAIMLIVIGPVNAGRRVQAAPTGRASRPYSDFGVVVVIAAERLLVNMEPARSNSGGCARPERSAATFGSAGLPAFSGVSGAWLRSRYPDTRRERHRVSSSEVKAPPRALRRERPVDYPTGSNARPQAQV